MLFSIENSNSMNNTPQEDPPKLPYLFTTQRLIKDFIEQQKSECDQRLMNVEFTAQTNQILTVVNAIFENGEKNKDRFKTYGNNFLSFYETQTENILQKSYDRFFERELELIINVRDICMQEDPTVPKHVWASIKKSIPLEESSSMKYVNLNKALTDCLSFEKHMNFWFPESVLKIFQYNFLKFIWSLMDFEKLFDIPPIDATHLHLRTPIINMLAELNNLANFLDNNCDVDAKVEIHPNQDFL